MKKIFSLVTAAALAIGGIMYAATGDVVYEVSAFTATPSDSQGDGSQWTRVNGGATSSWMQTSMIRANSLRIWQVVSSPVDQNDWLVSPILNLTPGKSYEVKMLCSLHAETSSAEHVGIHHLTEYPTVFGDNKLESSIDPATALLTLDNVNGVDMWDSVNKNYYFTMTGQFVAGEGDNYVALHVYGNYKGGIYLLSCEVTELEGGETPDPIDPDPVDPDPIEPEEHECAAQNFTPYESNIALSSSALDLAWTVVHEGSSPNQWKAYSETSMGACAYIQYNGSYDKNDYLISPSVHMDAGKEYIVSYKVKTNASYEREDMDVYLAESTDPATIKADGILVHKYEQWHTSKTVVTENYTVTAPKSGDYRLVFWAHSAKGMYNIFLNSVKILENVFAPAGVSNLTATPAENPTLEVNLSWTLPTTDVFGNPMAEDKTFEKLEIYRNEGTEPIATLTEPATSFTDSEATGLTAGKHSYSVIVTYSGTASGAVACGPTAYVGPFEILDVPAEMLVVEDMAGAWKIINGEGHDADNNSWVYYSSYSSNSMRMAAKYYTMCDSWIFSPEFRFTEPGYYEITINANLGGPYEKVYTTSFLSKGRSIDSEMQPLAIDWASYKTSATPQKAMVYVSEPGVYSVATHCFVSEEESESNGTTVYEIRGIDVNAGQMVPATVTDLTATPADDQSLSVALAWTNPTLSTAGTDLAEGSYYVEVYRQNGSDFDLLTTLTAGENTYTDEVPQPGAYTYGVQTLATETQAKVENQPTVTTSWVGEHKVSLPYSVYLNSNTPENASRLIWEPIDANEDGATWGIGIGNANRMECAQPVQMMEDKTDYYQYDDYLLSPVFEIEPGYYKVDFQMYGRTTNHKDTNDSYWNYNIYMNAGFAPEGFVPGRDELIGKTLFDASSTAYSSKNFTVYITEAGRYQLVFAADCINYKLYGSSYPLGLGLVKIEKVNVLPTVATDLWTRAGEEEALTCTFSWLNPTKSSVNGVEPVLTEARISRDDEEVATITDGLVPGERYTWEDDAVPTPGVHKYSVQLFTADGTHTAAAPSVASQWIGGGLEAPYSAEPGQFANYGWDQYAPLKTPTTWGGYSNCFDMTTNNGIRYDQAGTKDMDGYIITPKIKIEDQKKYKISFFAWKTSQNDEQKENGVPVEILVGNSGNANTWQSLGTVYVKNSSSSDKQTLDFFIYGEDALNAPVEEPEEEVEEPETEPELATLSEEEGDDNGAGEGEGEGTDPEEPVEPEEPEIVPGSTTDVPVAVPAGNQKIAFHLNVPYDSTVSSQGVFMFNKFNIDPDGDFTGIELVEVVDGVMIGANGISFDGTATNVAVYDLTGKLLSFTPKAEGSVSFDGLSKGLYIVRLTLEGGKDVALKIAL